jgi:hypothetical protein
MKSTEITVKSNKEDLGNVDVEVFESYAEAVEFFGKEPPEGKTGSDVVLAMINAQHKADVTNAFRVSKTRGVKPMTALREKVKSDPAAKAKLEELLAALGLPSNLG